MMTNWIPPVPAADSPNNSTMLDVIGSKLDTHAGDSIYSIVESILEHQLTPSMVHPTLANGVAVLSGGAWALGNFAVIVATNGITEDFDIHYISVEGLTANDTYDLVLYAGPNGSEVEVGRVRFVKNAVQDGTVNVPMKTALIDANAQIKAKLATSGGGDTATVSILYHVHTH